MIKKWLVRGELKVMSLRIGAQKGILLSPALSSQHECCTVDAYHKMHCSTAQNDSTTTEGICTGVLGLHIAQLGHERWTACDCPCSTCQQDGITQQPLPARHLARKLYNYHSQPWFAGCLLCSQTSEKYMRCCCDNSLAHLVTYRKTRTQTRSYLKFRRQRAS